MYAGRTASRRNPNLSFASNSAAAKEVRRQATQLSEACGARPERRRSEQSPPDAKRTSAIGIDDRRYWMGAMLLHAPLPNDAPLRIHVSQ